MFILIPTVIQRSITELNMLFYFDNFRSNLSLDTVVHCIGNFLALKCLLSPDRRRTVSLSAFVMEKHSITSFSTLGLRKPTFEML